jgi:hypothetical protein
MDETPDELRRPDEERRGQRNDPTGRDPLGGQPPPPDEDDEDEHQAPSRRRTLGGGRLAVAGVAVVVLLGGGVALAVNGDGGGDDDDAASSSDSSSANDPSAQEDAGWDRIEPGGDCQCADGSDWWFYVREADPTKVLFYLPGGGACWTAELCAQDGGDGSEGVYDPVIDDNPTMRDGIFALDDERNPFADWSMVYVPYCTGDVFLGNATREYAPGLIVQHKGYLNATTALDHMAATFPDATQVAVVGLSAGSVSAPLYGGLVSDRLPDADVTVLADGSGAYPASAGEQIAGPWGVADTIPDWPETAGLTPEQWSSPVSLYIQSGRHDPDVTFARHDYAYDNAQVFWDGFLDMPDDLLSGIDANEAEIEAAGVHVASYTAPGDEHGVVQYDSFYTDEVNGVKFVDWVAQLVAGEPVEDVHCTQCESG